MSETQGIVNLVYRYTGALARWFKAGRPVRDEAEIERIFETCCKPCEAYDAEHSLCRHCGCRINLMKVASMNKIAMATEQCPLGKWEADMSFGILTNEEPIS